MDIYQIVQSVLVYVCTAGFVTALGYMTTLYKRVIVLEQKVEFADKCYAKTAEQTSEQIKEILDVVTAISTRLTRLETKLEVRHDGNI